MVSTTLRRNSVLPNKRFSQEPELQETRLWTRQKANSEEAVIEIEKVVSEIRDPMVPENPEKTIRKRTRVQRKRKKSPPLKLNN